MSLSVIKYAVKTTALATVVLAGLQASSFAKDLPSQMTFGAVATGNVSAKKPDVSVNERAVKLAAWHHHLEINQACDDPSLGVGPSCPNDGNA
ncbi:hypothetical protein ACTUSR_15425 [Pantoea stewartii subsp. indologenes]|uniref:hypothetical protein n=1 Tax=Pantoea stewartii TaxID=66269 RepID=UPI001562BBF5|nr:hypothetical protein [Pantoea stewartii]NRH22255.1 hypothetical protein [Pantoea stewartii]